MNIEKYIRENLKINLIQEYKGDDYELALTRYIMILCSKIFYRNYVFFLDKENLKKRKEIYNRKISIDEIEDFSIICKSYCKIISDLLEKFEIESKCVSDGNDKFKHIYLQLKTKKENYYIIDPLMDLSEMKAYMKTNKFASKEFTEKTFNYELNEKIKWIDEEKLREIDEKIGYNYKGIYLDDIVEMLREEFEEIKEKDALEKKLDFINGSFNRKEGFKGFVEYYIFMQNILKRLLKTEEFSKLKISTFFVDNQDIKDKRIKSIFKNEKNMERKRGIVYVWDEKVYLNSLEGEFLKIEKKDWENIKKDNNIFCKKYYEVKSLNYLKENNADRNIIHNNEFLRIFNNIEKKMLENGVPKEKIKDYIYLNSKVIQVKQKNIGNIKFYIEEENLIIQDELKKEKNSVIYQDEGRNIIYKKIEYKERDYQEELER
ncbi:MAG: hypothetical protein Q4G05_03050 [Clostridia bacterium]|nr:hypothetical protein [Clostridia bacterium]